MSQGHSPLALNRLGQGATAIVFKRYSLPGFGIGPRAVKVPIGSSDSLAAFERECEVYRHIQHRQGPGAEYVIICYGIDSGPSLVLELCKETVRERLHRMRSEPSELTIGSRKAIDLAIRWSHEASQGLEFLHENDIVQADGASPILPDQFPLIML